MFYHHFIAQFIYSASIVFLYDSFTFYFTSFTVSHLVNFQGYTKIGNTQAFILLQLKILATARRRTQTHFMIKNKIQLKNYLTVWTLFIITTTTPHWDNGIVRGIKWRTTVQLELWQSGLVFLVSRKGKKA